jgi:uncharacterized cupin superfamily protein
MAVIRDPSKIEGRRGTIYPPEFAKGFEGRVKRALGNAGGLSQFGVNLTTLEPGAMSAQRHWHAKEDEFIYVLEGELTLVTDAGEEVLAPGMAATFPAGEANGHQLINKGTQPATYLEVGTRNPDEDAEYPDIDLRLKKRDGKAVFMHKSGEPYE